MGEIWPKKKSAGRRSIIEGPPYCEKATVLSSVPCCGAVGKLSRSGWVRKGLSDTPSSSSRAGGDPDRSTSVA